ncbi:MAG: hypothetical protein ACI3XQ_09570 [Eubacteriales bacterium]
MDKLFGLDGQGNHNGNLELLTTVYDPTHLAIVESILRGEKIPYLAKERGSGGAVKILAGYSVFGTDIFVLRDDLDRASCLLQPADEKNVGTEAE